MTSSITPNPAIHTMPALDSGEFTALDWQQLIAWGQTLLTEIEQAVAFALLNVSVLGVKPFAALQQFGGEVLGAVTDLQTLINDVGSGNIAGVVSEINKLTNDISALISGVGGTVIADVYNAINSAVDSLVALISGIGGSQISDVVNLILKIQQIIDSIVNALGIVGSGNPISAIVTALGNIPGGNISGEINNALLNAFSLFGQQPLIGLPFIPASHVVNSNPQLLWNSGFDTSVSVSANGGFTWDGTVGHTAAGSAKCAAHGVQCNMISSPIPVTQDETLNLSAWTQWSGLTTSGSSPAPIRMEALQYHAGVKVTSTAIVSEATPGASAGWTQLAGTFRVPGGVDTVYLSLIVDTTATGGSVWFDDASVYKAGTMMAGNTLHDAWENLLTALFGANSIEARFLDAVIPDITRALSSDLQGVIDVFHNVLGIPGNGHEVATLKAALLKIPGTLLAGPTAWDQALVSNLAIAFNGITAFENNIQATLIADVNFLESYAINYTNYIEGVVVSWVQNFVPNVIRSFF